MDMRARLTTPILAATLAATLPAAARGQTVVTDPGVVYTATALTGFATTGNDMGGMTVTAHFTNGSSSSASWGDLGGGIWGAETLAFRLGLGGGSDTYTSPWQLLDLSGLGIDRLLIHGAPGKTVFDVVPDPFLTDGSAQGNPFSIVGGDVFGTVATYRNLVRIGGAAPLADLFETLDISFQKSVGPNGMQFIADTDNIGVRGTITQTPEPATFGLLAAGAAGLLGVQWRRRRATA
jgi:hypothetical protein